MNIEGKNITKRFGEHTLFADLSFSIPGGEFVCFSGKSGTGKTTLLNIIGTIEAPTSGTMLYDGRSTRTRAEQAELLGNRIGFIFQNFALVETKTVRENLEIVRRKNRSGVTLEDALTRVGLYGKADQKVYTLSGGEQQRVALARLFYKKNDVILADEPTGSLDSDNAGVVMDILRELNRAGKTVVLVTHNEDIKKMCDRIITL